MPRPGATCPCCWANVIRPTGAGGPRPGGAPNAAAGGPLEAISCCRNRCAEASSWATGMWERSHPTPSRCWGPAWRPPPWRPPPLPIPPPPCVRCHMSSMAGMSISVSSFSGMIVPCAPESSPPVGYGPSVKARDVAHFSHFDYILLIDEMRATPMPHSDSSAMLDSKSPIRAPQWHSHH